MRPADEVEVAARRVLTGEPVLPGSIVNGPEQRRLDEREKEPVTAPPTPRPVAKATPAPSTPMTIEAPMSSAQASSAPMSPAAPVVGRVRREEVQARDKTGRERTRSPLRQESDALIAEAQDTDPVEEKAREFMEARAFETGHCLELLKLCKESKLKRSRRSKCSLMPRKKN